MSRSFLGSSSRAAKARSFSNGIMAPLSPDSGAKPPPNWVRKGASMWWKRKKLERLFDELRALTLLDRLQAGRAESVQNARTDPNKDLHACAKLQARQSELLAEIARLNSRPGLIGKLMSFSRKKVPNLVSTARGWLLPGKENLAWGVLQNSTAFPRACYRNCPMTSELKQSRMRLPAPRGQMGGHGILRPRCGC
jgi:hypothetical protein